MRSYATAMMRYFEFSGRSARAEFWLFTLVSLLLGLAAQFLDRASGTSPKFYLFISAVHLFPSLSVFARRMHDTGRSGWLFLLFFTVIGAIPLIIFLCQRSTPGANPYGRLPNDEAVPDPVGQLPGAPPPSPLPAQDPIREIERLAELRASGAISDAEFTTVKARVVGQRGATRIEPTL